MWKIFHDSALKSWLDRQSQTFGGNVMKRIVLSILGCLAFASAAQAKATSSIFPKNNAWVGIERSDAGIDEAAFNKVLDKIVAIYNPIVAAHGYQLNFNRLWPDGTVNSDTSTEGNSWVVNSYGGLARYTGMTSDGYAGVACHELGHHLGGAPVFNDGSDMSVEGEADYHVGTKCLHKYFAGDDNKKIVAAMKIDPVAAKKCTAAYVGNADEIALCERSAMAGFVLADILRSLGGSAAIAFDTPDKSQVTVTYEDHPEAQCRLDTYFASALCTVSSDVEFSTTDAKVGACNSGVGARPLCWYKP
jgi:hypothetical protein